VIAFGEIARPVRLLNIPLAIWIAVAPWVLSGATDVSRWADLAIAALLVMLSIPRGRIEQAFGGWNRYLI
jgi:hypothetical protein